MRVRFKTAVTEPESSLANKTGSWRVERPAWDAEKCTDCKLCILVCPEGCIYTEDKRYVFDLDYCKGCGICSEECPVKAIGMEREEI